MCHDEYVSVRRIGVLEAGAVVFLFDIGDECVESADHVFGGSDQISMSRGRIKKKMQRATTALRIASAS